MEGMDTRRMEMGMGGRITADRNVRHFKGFWFTSQFHHGHCLLKDADLIGFPGERQREREREREREILIFKRTLLYPSRYLQNNLFSKQQANKYIQIHLIK